MPHHTPFWIDQKFRQWMDTLPHRMSSIEAFHTAVQPVLAYRTDPALAEALRERNWIVVEHRLRALDHQLSRELVDDVLDKLGMLDIVEKAVLIRRIRMLTDQANCFRGFPTTPMGRPNGHRAKSESQ